MIPPETNDFSRLPKIEGGIREFPEPAEKKPYQIVASRINFGRAICIAVGVELALGALSYAIDSPWPVILGSIALVWEYGEAVFDLHTNRNQTREFLHSTTRLITKPYKDGQ